MLTVKLRMQKWNELAAVESEHLVKKSADASQPSANGLAKSEADSPAANRIDLLQTRRVDRRDAARKRTAEELHGERPETSTANQKQSSDRVLAGSQGQHDETSKVGMKPPELNDLNRARLDNRANLQTVNCRNALERRPAGLEEPGGCWNESVVQAVSLRRGANLESGRRSQTSEPAASREAAKQNHNSLALPNSDKFNSIRSINPSGRPFESIRRHSHDFTRNAPLGYTATNAASINQRINQFGRFKRANQQVDLKPGHLAGELPASRVHQSDRLCSSKHQTESQTNDRPTDEILSSVGRAQFAGDSSSRFATNPFVKNRNVSNFQRSVSDLSNVILRKSLVLENRSINPSNEPRHPLKLNLKNLEQKLDTSFGHTLGKLN